MDGALLSVRGLAVDLPGERGPVRAVRDVSFDLDRREVLGVVGESGCGKTTTALALAGLLAPRAVVTGSITLDGEELVGRDEKAWRAVRGARIGTVFQDALGALHPAMTIGAQVAEAVAAHGGVSRGDAQRRAQELLGALGLADPEQVARRHPHELSGGMRQRVMLACALAGAPDVLVADEPTTALDVTVQAQVLDLLRSIRDARGTAIILVTHDLGVVASLADRVCVLYAGRVVEEGSVDAVLGSPAHPYTRALLAARPRPDVPRRPGSRLPALTGRPPAAGEVVRGCPFHPRCPEARLPDPCATQDPSASGGDGGPSRWAACHFAPDRDSAEVPR